MTISRPPISRKPGRKLVRRLPVALLPLLVAAPRLAWACSVCTAGRDDESRTAFILMTAFMTFLPLLLVGGILWWLRRRFREISAAERAAEATRAAPLAVAPQRVELSA
jgi:MYXO-CTERM domain-containing protein